MAESQIASGDPGKAVRAIADVARAAGAEGMVGGQQMDLAAEKGDIASARAEEIGLRKTAALLASCARVGAILGGGAPAQIAALGKFGARLGLLFQITDDILDETAVFEEMGKGVRKDRIRGKRTYVADYGLAAAMERVDALGREALESLAAFGEEATPLRELVKTMQSRRS